MWTKPTIIQTYTDHTVVLRYHAQENCLYFVLKDKHSEKYDAVIGRRCYHLFKRAAQQLIQKLHNLQNIFV